MTSVTRLTIIILISYVILPAEVPDYRQTTPMSALTDPSSRFYVPVPYPTNRSEILLNLKDHIKKRRAKFFKTPPNLFQNIQKHIRRFLSQIRYFLKYGRRITYRESKPNEEIYYFAMLKTLFLDNSEYAVGDIVFIADCRFSQKHADPRVREYFEDKDRYILIDILNRDRLVVTRLKMEKNGIVSSWSSGSKKQQRFYKSLKNFINNEGNMNRIISRMTSNIENYRLVSYAGIGYPFNPTLKIRTTDPKMTYYYKIDKKQLFLQLGKNSYPFYNGPKELDQISKYRLYDAVRNEIIFLLPLNGAQE